MIKEIKNCYGLQSPSLAKYLGVSIDMMNSVLSDRRTLDLAQWLATEKLHQALETNIPLENLALIQHTLTSERQKTAGERNKQIIKLERKIERKQVALSRLKALRSELLRGLHACRSLLNTDLSTHEREWLELRRKHILWKLDQNSLINEQTLEAEIEGLQCTRNKLNEY